ncbi:MAG: TonB-dependent receptor [Acidobacteriales bacterium]|nr:TonB-dependent receptor [Terriglobales bacterium]
MHFSFTRWLCLALTLTLLLTPAWSQSTTGSLTAVAADPTGAMIVDATVTVRHVETNITRTAHTNSDGRAYFPALAIGSYEVTIQKSGFAKVSRSGINVLLNQTAVVTQELKPAGSDEVVLVTEDAPLVNTTNSELGVRFDSDRLSDLPTSGMGALGGGFRDVFSFGLSAPGVSQINQGNTGFAAGTDYAVNGARVRSNNFIVDGQDVNEPGVSGVGVVWNNPDAIKEFQMITNQFTAEYGRNSGSVVNVVTKQGTNAFHGSAFWFHNSNPFNSLNNLDKANFTEAPLRIENQLGGTFGGPLYRNRTFFFGSLQRWSDRQLGSGSKINSAPTAAGQALLQANGGNRALVQALLTHLPAAGGQTGTVTYCFNPAQWNGPGAPPQWLTGTATGDTGLACRFQLANNQRSAPVAGWTPFGVPVGEIIGANRITFNNWQWSTRVDHQLTSKHSINGRYMYNDTYQEGTGQATPAGLANINPLRTQAAVFGVTSTLTTRWLNEFRIAYNRFATSTSPQDPISLTIPSIEVSELGLNGFNAVGTRTAIGYGVNLPQSRINNIYQVTNNMGYTLSSHSMRWGVDFRKNRIRSDFNPNVRGQLRFGSLTNLVADFADLTAQLNQFLPGGQRIMYYDWNDWGFFFQDDWKVTPHFTLNLGLRYELPGNSVESIYEVNDRIVAANGANELFRYTSRPPDDTNNLMPRFGFNWNPQTSDSGMIGWLTGGNKLVIRGGFTRAFDYAFLNMALNVTSAFPFQAAFSIPRTPNSFANLFNQTLSTATLPCNALPAGVAVAKCLNQTRISDGFRAPYADQFSFDIQRQIGANNSFRIGWVATKGTGLFQSLEGNPVLTCQTGTCPRVDNFQGVIRVRANTGSSIYHSLQTSFDRRLSRGLNGGVHYTYSSFIDDASEVFNPSSAEVATMQNPLDPNKTGERARSTYDRPHRISTNIRYELPFMRTQQGFVGRVVGGWTVATLMTFQSGSPFTVLNGLDPGQLLRGSLVGNAIRPNFAPGVTAEELRGMSVEEIRAAILSANSIGAFFTGVTPANPAGNVPRNFLRGDGLASVDFSLVKEIKVREGHALQFRADAFNLPNHRNFGIPLALINTTPATFLDEKATDGGNRRIFLALRYTF